MTLLTTLRNLILAITSKLGWLPPLFARFTVGTVFIISGWAKLHSIPDVTEFFQSLGIPAPAFHAHLVSCTEFTCGTLILLGLLTRVASVPLIITMAVALITAKREDIETWDDVLAFSEYLYIVLLTWLAIAGAGAVSLDRILARRLFKKA